MGVRFSIKSAFKTVIHWNGESGAGVDVHGNKDSKHWSVDASHLKGTVAEYQTKEELQARIESDLKKYLSSNLYTDDVYLIVMDDGRIDTNFIEDGEGNILDADEQDEHQNKKTPMYLCDYTFEVEIQSVYHPEIEELNALLPNSEHA
jgi:hypothetical protein